MASAMTNLVTGTMHLYGLRFSLCFEPLVLARRAIRVSEKGQKSKALQNQILLMPGPTTTPPPTNSV